MRMMAERGWTKEEVEQALGMLYSEGKQEKHLSYQKRLNRVVYWSALMLLAMANFVISVILVPFILTLGEWQLSLTLFILGLTFGLIFNHLVNDIEHLETHHEYLAVIFIPAIGIMNMFIMATLANRVAQTLGLPVHENPLFISTVYVIGLLLPYGFRSFQYWWEKRSA